MKVVQRRGWATVATVVALAAGLVATGPAPVAGAGPQGDLSTWGVTRFDLHNAGMAYSPLADRVLVAVADDVPVLGNHLVELDPDDASISRTLELPGNPSEISVSDDGARAYVGFHRASQIVEVDLAALTVVRRIELGDMDASIVDIDVQPGRHDVILATYRASSQRLLRVFDDGVERPVDVLATQRSVFYVFGDLPSTVYGLGGNQLRRYRLDDTGLHGAEDMVTFSSQGDPEFVDGTLTTREGRVIRPEADQEIGDFHREGAFEVVGGQNDTFFLDTEELTRSNSDTQVPTGSRAITWPRLSLWGPRDLVDTGDGLAGAGPFDVLLAGPDVVTGAVPALPAAPPSILRTNKVVTVDAAADELAAPPEGSALFAALASPPRLVELDRRTGEIRRTVALPERAKALEVSLDGSTLMVGLTGRVLELDASRLRVRHRVTLFDESALDPRTIAPSPEGPGTYVVEWDTPCRSSFYDQLSLVRDGAVEPDRLPSERPIAFTDDPTRLHVLDNGSAGYRVEVTGTGLVSIPDERVRPLSVADPIVLGDRVYGSPGRVIVPSRQATVGGIAEGGSLVPAPGRHRLFQFAQGAPWEFDLAGEWLVAKHAALGTSHSEETTTSTSLAFLGSSSKPRIVPFTSAPRRPTNVRAHRDGLEVTVTWEPPTDDGGRPITAYRIYRNSTRIGEVGPTARSFEDELAADLDADYFVSAVNDVGEGPKARATEGAAPTVVIRTPADGSTVDQGDDVAADYACADTDGTVVDCEGTVADGAPVPTSDSRSHTFTVTAEDDAGNITRASSTYTVTDAEDPQVEIVVPADGAAYTLDEVATVDFRCDDSVGGTPITSCTGTAADGARVPTGTAGTRTFTVRAEDASGRVTERTVHYLVDATDPTVTLLSPRQGATYPADTEVILDVRCGDESGGSGLADCRISANISEGGSFINVENGPVDTTEEHNWVIRVDAVDRAGNVGIRQFSFRVRDPRCDNRRVNVDLNLGERPTAGNDVIFGTPRGEVIDGLGGNDWLCGGGGGDTLRGGPGADYVEGSDATDTVEGGIGNDELQGGDGPDAVRGGQGVDQVYGGPGFDHLFGGTGNDRLFGGAGVDDCDGGAGRDGHDRCEHRIRFP